MFQTATPAVSSPRTIKDVEEGKPFLGNQKDQNDGAEQPKKGDLVKIIHKVEESDEGYSTQAGTMLG